MNEDSLLVQSIKDYAIFMLNPQGIIISWNKGAQRIKGYSADEIIGKHFSIFYIDEDLKTEKPKRVLEIAMKEGKYEEEGWRKKKDGSLFWANLIISPVFNEKGEHIGFSKITRDLTEKKQAEELLRRSEQRYRLLVEQVEDYGIFMLDKNGNISSWNEGAQRINGYRADEVIGKHFSIFYPEEDVKSGKPKKELEIAVQTGKYEEEGWRIRKGGSRFWSNVVITAIFNHGGKELVGFAKVTRDLTERKKAETDLQESYERYRHLAEELNQTNIQLSEANRQLEQFASIASHDLKEPLRKIRTFSDLILRDSENNLSEEGEKNLGKIMDASKRMTNMIEDILAFSSLTEVQECEEISLEKILDETLELLDELIKEKNAIIKSDKLPTACVIHAQMVQLFQNLLSNSLKFTEKEVRPKIEITHKYLNKKELPLAANLPGKKYLQLLFKDNGIGFDQNNAEKIFDLFKRLHNRAEYSGTGIGLAIARKVVENHHGFITAESETGNGATFKILLPQD